VRLQVLTAASVKIKAFWDIAPCSLFKVDRRFRCTYCLHHQGVMVEAVRTSEMSVYSNKTKRRYIPEDSNILLNKKFWKELIRQLSLHYVTTR
jgi:hypothetical protein